MTPDNDTSTAPFGALAPNAAQAAVIRLVQRSGLKRGVFRPWMSRLINLMRPGPVDAQYQGASFRFYHLLSATERGALFNPDYNLDELSFLRAHTPDGGVFVDIGANVGTYALTLANKVGKSGTVIAVEPHPVAHDRLAFNRAASGLAQVKLLAAAAGAENGELLMETDSANLGASHVASGASGGHTFRVPAFTLQQILSDAGVSKMDALKIDVEGFEDRVLTCFFAQAPQTLWPRAVVIEHLERKNWQHDCIDDMVSRGYREERKTRSNTLLARG
ncbi:FkbM family methyltransferase [Bradyrhizobium sp.]|uniref:FkbM family methyltransferase n=1 Tax=Bradyrhizobium sp. TaxID=376 RepID=UPI002D3C5E4E|nr:FkbM family methyltransferase [Bradyrhizobium sp.]HZR71473.1 FkbM family methyltransferase [Bradyrhizobium sp.]